MYISSDSDDDLYGNLPQKLQKLMKKKRKPLPTCETQPEVSNSNETVDLSNYSEPKTESNRDVIVVPDNVFDTYRPKAFNTDEVIVVPDEDKDYDSTSLFLSDPVSVIGLSTKRKSSDSPRRGAKRGRGKPRGRCKATVVEPPVSHQSGPITRAAKKAAENSFTAPVISPITIAQPKTRRGRGSKSQPAATSSPVQRGRGRRAPSTPVQRGRGRGKGRTPRSTQIPIYSIGNTDEYYDASDNQAIFIDKPQDSFVIDLNDSIDNELLSVKVEWQSIEVVKFNIRKLQKLTQMFDHFAEQEGVSRDQLLFTYNDKIIKSDDTPESIDYNIAKFIEGGIVNSRPLPELSTEVVKTKQKGFKLKFQCLKLKKPFEVTINKDDRLSLALIKCAEHLELPISSLRFEFDGETVKGNMTPKEMDIDSGDCIDVKIVNVNK